MRRRCAALILLLMMTGDIRHLRAASMLKPVEMDWRGTGQLYLLLNNGDVIRYDATRGETHQPIRGARGFRAAQLVSPVSSSPYFFISGFLARSGVVMQYTSDGKLVAQLQTPELAAGMDIDPTPNARVLYLVSAVSSSIYSIRPDQTDRPAKEVAFIKEARNLGPVFFDAARNKLLVGDLWTGSLYEIDCKSGSYQVVLKDLGEPVSLALDPSTKVLYVADAAHGRVNVFSYDPKKGFVRSKVINTGLQDLSAIALAPGGLFVSDLKTGVYKYSSSDGLKHMAF